jgi:hypothetical protein
MSCGDTQIIAGVCPMTTKLNSASSCMADQEAQPGVGYYTECPPTSILSSLRSTVLRSSPVRGLRLIVSQLRSCYHSIQSQKKTGQILDFDCVRASLPPLSRDDDPANRIDRHSYIAGIRALERERPWLTLADYELFLQGWFQADACIHHNADMKACNLGKETRITPQGHI